MTLDKELRDLAVRYLRRELDEEQNVVDDECVGCAGPCKVVDVAAKLQKDIGCLEVELSARKQDSEVLTKVVKTVDTWHRCMIPTSLTGCTDLIKVLDDILVDYLDAPEGPDDTPIDEPQEITVTFAFLELP